MKQTSTFYSTAFVSTMTALIVACGGGGDSYTTEAPEPEQPTAYATAADLSASAWYCNRVNAEGKFCNVWNVEGRYIAAEGPVCFERTVCLAPTVPLAAGKGEGGAS